MATEQPRSCSIIVRLTWAPQDAHLWADQFVTTGDQHRCAVGRDAIVRQFGELLDELIAGRLALDDP